MQRISTIRKASLSNGQHLSLMSSLAERLSALADTPEKMRAAIVAFQEAVADESKYLRVEQGSELTAMISEADVERDMCYRKLCGLVRSWYGSGVEPQDSAAADIRRIINDYRLRTSAQLDDESGMMGHFVRGLSAEAMRPQIEALGAAALLERMCSANNRVVELLAQRDEQRKGRLVGAMEQARLVTDRAYAEVSDAIEAFNYVTDGYGDFIISWNATIARYKEMLARK